MFCDEFTAGEPMPRLALSFACCRYDRMEAIREGDVVPEGIDLNCITLRSGREIFDRMVGGREFDVAELSASEFISLAGRGDCPFVALPVFPSRVFRHGYVFINTRRVRAPKDLEGKRVGLPLYTQTAAIWARGLLAHQFDVDLDSIQWVEGAVEKAGTHGKPHAPPLLRPVRIEHNKSAEPLGALLARGAIDALIGSRKPEELGRHPEVARLFPDYRARERQFYEQSKIFPIMHLIAIRRELYQRQPWIASSLYNAFVEFEAARAKAPALCGLARRDAAVADRRRGGDRRPVWRRCIPLRHRGQSPDLAGAGRIHGRTGLHRPSDCDRGFVRPARRRVRNMTGLPDACPG